MLFVWTNFLVAYWLRGNFVEIEREFIPLNNEGSKSSHRIGFNIKEEIVDKIFILYPNPNPKLQDLNKRWHAMPFFGYLIKILKPGGSIVIRTNEKFYAEEANHFIKEVWNLENKQTSFKKEDVSHFKTLFEKKYLERSQTCYEVSGLKIV